MFTSWQSMGCNTEEVRYQKQKQLKQLPTLVLVVCGIFSNPENNLINAFKCKLNQIMQFFSISNFSSSRI